MVFGVSVQVLTDKHKVTSNHGVQGKSTRDD